MGCFCSSSSSRARMRVCLRVRDATVASASLCCGLLIAESDRVLSVFAPLAKSDG